MLPISWPTVIVKLEKENKTYKWVLFDLLKIEEMLETVATKFPNVGSAIISDKLYLENEGLQQLVISKFEFLLNSLGKISKQREIKDVIKNSTILKQIEKDWLMYLFLSRHTVAHTGGHCDEIFLGRVKSDIKKLKVKMSEGDLVLLHPYGVITCINIILKIIILEIAKDSLSTDERNTLGEHLQKKIGTV